MFLNLFYANYERSAYDQKNGRKETIQSIIAKITKKISKKCPVERIFFNQYFLLFLGSLTTC